AGYFALAPRPLAGREVLERMVDAVRHRGPDDAGVYLDGRCGLGHRRLSIIDLSGGRQPLATADRTLWITFNGEIFNYVELRARLLGRGCVFRTRTDTETILHAYAEHGPGGAALLNGDFAYALWDRRRSRLVLARDRMGVRPLYYAVRDGVLVFASEVKALLRYPGIRAELDPLALDQCFTFWAPLAPRTAFKDVLELPPGHQLIAENGRITIAPYWTLTFPPRIERVSANEAELADEVETLLDDATRIRLRADVPVGSYLSGGFDSSATTALARRHNGERLRTFSLEFESPELDEAPWQRMMVEALGTEHSALRCRRADIAAHFPDVIRHTERPIVRSAPAALYLLARQVRDHGFKVVLTGEGADEVFGGYDIFKEDKVRRFWARQPASKWRPLLLRRLYPYLGSLQSQPARYLEAFFRAGLERSDDPLFSHLPRFALTRRIGQFYSAELRAALERYDPLEELRRSLPAEFASWHPLSRAQYLETGCLLPGYILSSQGDRVAMAHAVEGRFPFLDHRVVELGARLPPGLKLKGLREKHLLRRALGRHLPGEIAERPKQPYRAPDAESFAGPEAPEYVQALLSPGAIARAGYFEPRAVGHLLAKCARAPSGASAGLSTGDNMAFMAVLSTQLLHSHFVGALI
ncbi:MAG TPA: asparagine synthase (glutamine-hydrolyzing), partial [Burkholderiales bacterium]|nr:asparagine synthase (glutamine-hydrolyzing) [Burkholderiales bacterium]